MRVLVVHNAYQLRGGEDAVVQNEIDLLRSYGHVVETWLVSNDSIKGWVGKLAAVAGMVFSLPSYLRMLALLRRSRPDVVHVHNFFPLLSPAVFYACAQERVPVVMTLHNFRMICPTATLSFEGKITERSLVQGPWWGVGNGVYRHSKLATFMLAVMISVHRRMKTWSSKVTRLIALSDFARDKFMEAGIPGEHIVVKGNFAPESSVVGDAERSGFLYAGRFSPEKGVDVLIRAASGEGWDVRLAGAGSVDIGDAAGVTVLGMLGRRDLDNEIASALALVVPSVCYEMFGMTVIEAFALGTPVIASRIGTLGALVEDGIDGLLFIPGDWDDLRHKMQWASANPDRMAAMGRAARRKYEQFFSPGRNCEQLLAIYEAAIADEQSKVLV